MTGPRRSLSLKLSDTRACEPQIRAQNERGSPVKLNLLGLRTKRLCEVPLWALRATYTRYHSKLNLFTPSLLTIRHLGTPGTLGNELAVLDGLHSGWIRYAC